MHLRNTMEENKEITEKLAIFLSFLIGQRLECLLLNPMFNLASKDIKWMVSSHYTS